MERNAAIPADRCFLPDADGAMSTAHGCDVRQDGEVRRTSLSPSGATSSTLDDRVTRPVLTSAGDDIQLSVGRAVDATSWGRGGLDHDGAGTAFVLVLTPACLTVAHGAYPLPAGSYAVVPDRARIDGGSGLVITHREHRGLLQVGGPVESQGRLRYIDGCSDTVLVAPVVKGDPCLNLLHVPPQTAQSDHEHPSVRIGLVVGGAGSCVLDHDWRATLREGSVFVLPAHTTHRFETASDETLLVMAWHPDSDVGPTDDDHPMLNRTLRPGMSARVR